MPNMATRAHSIEIFETLAVKNVYVARVIDLITIPTKSGPLQIVSLPWLTRSNLISKEEYRGRTLAELNELMIQKMESSLQHKFHLLNPDIPSVLAVHASLADASYGSERSIMLGQDLVIQKSLLAADRFDYVAFGHIHKHQDFIAGDTPIVYAGSIERVDFGEEKEPKGFVLVEIDDPGGGRFSRKTEWKFQADHKTRRFHTVEINLEDLEENSLINPTEAAIQRLKGEDNRLRNLDKEFSRGLAEAVVRVKLKLRPEQEAAIREDDLRRVMEKELGIYYIAAINREVDKIRRTRLAGLNVEELSPLQLLETYLKSKNLPEARLELLLKHAGALIQGVPTNQ